jgi:hypothetical protein
MCIYFSDKFLPESPINEAISSSSTLLSSPSFTRQSRLSDVVENIEDKYLNKTVQSELVEGHNDPPRLAYLSILPLRTDDWRLWRVKCTVNSLKICL